MTTVVLKIVVSGLVAIVYGSGPASHVSLLFPVAGGGHHDAAMSWVDPAAGISRKPLQGVELRLIPQQIGTLAVDRKTPGCPKDLTNGGAPVDVAQYSSTDWSVEMSCLGQGLGRVPRAVVEGGTSRGVASKLRLAGMPIRVRTQSIALEPNGKLQGIAFEDLPPSSGARLHQVVADSLTFEATVSLGAGESLRIEAWPIDERNPQRPYWTAVPLVAGGEAKIVLSNDMPVASCPSIDFALCEATTQHHFAVYDDFLQRGPGATPKPKFRGTAMPPALSLVFHGSARPICMMGSFEEN